MRVAVIQHDIAWEDPKANFAALAPRIAGAAGAGARLIVLTEMYATGFSMNTDVTAEPVGGPAASFLVEQAQRHDAWIAGSVAERVDATERPFNTLVLAAPDGAVHRYCKIHPFTHSGEHEHFRAGSDHVTVDVEGLRVTLFVCYDLRFADEFWATAQDTDVYIVPANWPDTRREHWRTLLRARAVENQAYVLGVNRVGTGGRLTYVGDSMVVDPMGEVLASAADREALLVCDVDAATVAATRDRFRFMQDRR
ncbi:MAG TPA: nitrilase-related carbon-nitrogen hydrolase [Euzebyales bacterium]|nr:nitrilase-related carbon-nitrogen hydrolase [Euzebyales bacterium]